MKISYFVYFSFLLLLVSACGLEREIDINLPEYNEKLVVECYLERGKPIQLLLTESQAFLSPADSVPFVLDAKIRIKNQSKTYELFPVIRVDSAFGKLYNYVSLDTIPANPSGIFELEISDTKGRIITGQTKLLDVLPLKEYSWEFEDVDAEVKDDSAKAYVVIRHGVSPSDDNYRFIINRKKGNVFSNDLDFEYKGITATNGEITVGSPYNYQNNDTLQIQLYHIERQFLDYLRSVEAAADAAGNPFAQPSPIISSVKGGLGIFTTIQYDEVFTIVKK